MVSNRRLLAFFGRNIDSICIEVLPILIKVAAVGQTLNS